MRIWLNNLDILFRQEILQVMLLIEKQLNLFIGARNSLDEMGEQGERDYEGINENEGDIRKDIDNGRSRSVSKSVDHASTKVSGYDDFKEEQKDDIVKIENDIVPENENLEVKHEEHEGIHF